MPKLTSVTSFWVALRHCQYKQKKSPSPEIFVRGEIQKAIRKSDDALVGESKCATNGYYRSKCVFGAVGFSPLGLGVEALKVILENHQ